jgi:hypothetical protein
MQVPRGGTINEGSIVESLGPVPGAVLVEEAVKRRASGTTVQPKDERLLKSVRASSGHKPVVEVASVCLIDVDVPRKLESQGSFLLCF